MERTSPDSMNQAIIKKIVTSEDPFLNTEPQSGFECLITSMLTALEGGLALDQIIRNVKSVITDLELLFEGDLETSVKYSLMSLLRKHLLRQDAAGEYWVSENGRAIGSELLSRFRLKIVGS